MELATVKQGSIAPQQSGFEFNPQTFNEALKIAEVISSSGMVPKQYERNPSACLVAISMGAEVGLKPLQALQNIAVINNRATLWGDAILALIQNSGLLEDFSETFDEKNWAYTCMMKRKGYASATIQKFSKEDAQRAGLWDKQGPWKQYPKRMLQMRARGFCARDLFSDVLKGFGLAEEAQDLNGYEEAHDFSPKSKSGGFPKVVDPQIIEAKTVESEKPAKANQEQVKSQEKVEFVPEVPVEITTMQISEISKAIKSNPEFGFVDQKQVIVEILKTNFGIERISKLNQDQLPEMLKLVAEYKAPYEPGSEG